MNLHVLLPVHNRRETTLRCVRQLAAQGRGDVNLVLVDDGSTDGTAEAVRAAWPGATILTGAGDWWWAGSLAQGCRHLARSGVRDEDVVLLLNDDVEFAPDFLSAALAELTAHPGTLLLARQVDAATGQLIDGGGGVRADVRTLRFAAARTPGEINCLPTRGLFLRWADLRRAGGFEPRLLPHYLSDYEFTLRAGRAGLRLRVADQAAVRVRLDATGRSLATLGEVPFARRWALLFSPRFKDNPVAWSAFVRLASPPVLWPWLWLKVWAHFALVTVPAVFAPRR